MRLFDNNWLLRDSVVVRSAATNFAVSCRWFQSEVIKTRTSMRFGIETFATHRYSWGRCCKTPVVCSRYPPSVQFPADSTYGLSVLVIYFTSYNNRMCSSILDDPAGFMLRYTTVTSAIRLLTRCIDLTGRGNVNSSFFRSLFLNLRVKIWREKLVKICRSYGKNKSLLFATRVTVIDNVSWHRRRAVIPSAGGPSRR